MEQAWTVKKYLQSLHSNEAVAVIHNKHRKLIRVKTVVTVLS